MQITIKQIKGIAKELVAQKPSKTSKVLEIFAKGLGARSYQALLASSNIEISKYKPSQAIKFIFRSDGLFEFLAETDGKDFAILAYASEGERLSRSDITVARFNLHDSLFVEHHVYEVRDTSMCPDFRGCWELIRKSGWELFLTKYSTNPAKEITAFVDRLAKKISKTDPAAVPGESDIGEIAMYQRLNWWGEHPHYPRSEWRREAGDNDTQLGYWDWVEHQVEMHNDDDDSGDSDDESDETDSDNIQQHPLYEKIEKFWDESTLDERESFRLTDVTDTTTRGQSLWWGDLNAREQNAIIKVMMEHPESPFRMMHAVTTAPQCLCPHCKADLTLPSSVTRLYVNKDDEDDSAVGVGHYLPDGSFEPDSNPGLGRGRFDLFEDSDSCTSCSKKI